VNSSVSFPSDSSIPLIISFTLPLDSIKDILKKEVNSSFIQIRCKTAFIFDISMFAQDLIDSAIDNCSDYQEINTLLIDMRSISLENWLDSLPSSLIRSFLGN